ncbi:MAG: acyltransferase family protein [Sporichthyaceae bacterium]
MTARVASEGEAGPSASHAFRSDVQGLRALAVALVLWFHLWPHTLPGGFIGVDVFFVLSGFLITNQLLQRPPTGPSDLLVFWSRRIRRLLPAALVVVTTAMVAAKLLGPPDQARFGGIDGLVTILYLQNWNLAETSANPLTAAQVPPVVQHFWSLSVEEQFYVAWPVLLVGAVLLARRRGWGVLKSCGLTMAAVVTLSLAFSIYYTERHPSQAYFATPTRIWELAAGGLLAAVLLHRSRNGCRDIPVWVRELAVWAGFGVLVLTLITFDKSRPFPGWIALAPVLGTMAIIAAGRERGPNPNRVLGTRPGRYLGDLSYSIYLWHVPLIVLWPQVTGQPIRLGDGAVIAIASLVLAAATKRHVEDRFRYRSPRPAQSSAPAPSSSSVPVGV